MNLFERKGEPLKIIADIMKGKAFLLPKTRSYVTTPSLKVTATVGTDGTEFSRARWGGIILVEAGKGKKLMKKLKNKGITETLNK